MQSSCIHTALHICMLVRYTLMIMVTPKNCTIFHNKCAFLYARTRIFINHHHIHMLRNFINKLEPWRTGLHYLSLVSALHVRTAWICFVCTNLGHLFIHNEERRKHNEWNIKLQRGIYISLWNEKHLWYTILRIEFICNLSLHLQCAVRVKGICWLIPNAVCINSLKFNYVHHVNIK